MLDFKANKNIKNQKTSTLQEEGGFNRPPEEKLRFWYIFVIQLIQKN